MRISIVSKHCCSYQEPTFSESSTDIDDHFGRRRRSYDASLKIELWVGCRCESPLGNSIVRKHSCSYQQPTFSKSFRHTEQQYIKHLSSDDASSETRSVGRLWSSLATGVRLRQPSALNEARNLTSPIATTQKNIKNQNTKQSGVRVDPKTIKASNWARVALTMCSGMCCLWCGL
jgi:hypothetical protein